MWCDLKESRVVTDKQVPVSILVSDIKLKKNNKGQKVFLHSNPHSFPSLGRMVLLG